VLLRRLLWLRRWLCSWVDCCARGSIAVPLAVAKPLVVVGPLALLGRWFCSAAGSCFPVPVAWRPTAARYLAAAFLLFGPMPRISPTISGNCSRLVIRPLRAADSLRASWQAQSPGELAHPELLAAPRVRREVIGSVANAIGSRLSIRGNAGPSCSPGLGIKF
jgi:hypothetical protein